MTGSRPPDHDPEHDVAAYVAGELSRKELHQFELHLLECDRCWREVRLGRTGRRMAEQSWEAAPAHLRENVRAAVTLIGSRPRRRPPWGLAALSAAMLATVLLALAVSNHRGSQPPEIEAALSFYRTGASASASATRPAPDLDASGLAFLGEGSTRLGSMTSDAFVYRGETGGRVVLFLASDTFPKAAGAIEDGGMTEGWTARADGLVMFCGSRPASFLLIGTDAEILRAAASALAAAPSLAT